MSLFTLFHGAGASGHVFLVANGKRRDKGLAYSGLIGPLSTVAVVPTTTQIIHFSVEAKTKDKQEATISGSVSVTLNPALAVSKFDFTIDRKGGGYIGKWLETLRAEITENVIRAILEQVKQFTVEGVILEQAAIETAVSQALARDKFTAAGILIESCSIPNIAPSDDDVANSIGAKERQSMLELSDKALHDRRIKAAQNERAVRQYEADTKLELEKKQGELLEEQAKNKQAEANADAAAMTARLEPMRELSPGTLLGVSMMELSKNGKLGTVNLTSEFFAAVSAVKE